MMDDYIMDLLFFPAEPSPPRSPTPRSSTPKVVMASIIADDQVMMGCLVVVGVVTTGFLLKFMIRKFLGSTYEPYRIMDSGGITQDESPGASYSQYRRETNPYDLPSLDSSGHLFMTRPRLTPPRPLFDTAWALPEYRRGDYYFPPPPLTPRPSPLPPPPLPPKPFHDFTMGSSTKDISCLMNKHPTLGSTDASPPRVERRGRSRLSVVESDSDIDKGKKRRFLVFNDDLPVPCEAVSNPESQKDAKSSVRIDEFGDVMCLQAKSCNTSSVSKTSMPRSLLTKSSRQNSSKKPTKKSTSLCNEEKTKSHTRSKSHGTPKSAKSPLYISAGKYAVQVTTIDSVSEKFVSKEGLDSQSELMTTENMSALSLSKLSETKDSPGSRNVMFQQRTEQPMYLNFDKSSPKFSKSIRRVSRLNGATQQRSALVTKSRKQNAKKKSIQSGEKDKKKDVSEGCDESTTKQKVCDLSSLMSKPSGRDKDKESKTLGEMSMPTMTERIGEKSRGTTKETLDIRDPKYFSAEKREAEAKKNEESASNRITKSLSRCSPTYKMLNESKKKTSASSVSPATKDKSQKKSRAEKPKVRSRTDEFDESPPRRKSRGKDDKRSSSRKKSADGKENSENTVSRVVVSNRNKNRIICNNHDLLAGHSIDLVTFSKKSSFCEGTTDRDVKTDGNSSKDIGKESRDVTQSLGRVNVLSEWLQKSPLCMKYFMPNTESKNNPPAPSATGKLDKLTMVKPTLPKRHLDSSRKNKPRLCAKGEDVQGDGPSPVVLHSQSNSMKLGDQNAGSFLLNEIQPKCVSFTSNDSNDPLSHQQKHNKNEVNVHTPGQESEASCSRLPRFKFNNEYLLYIESPPESVNAKPPKTSQADIQNTDPILFPIGGGRLQIFRSLTPQLSLPSSEGKQSDAQKMNDDLVEERIEQLRESGSRHKKLKRHHIGGGGSESSLMSFEASRSTMGGRIRFSKTAWERRKKIDLERQRKQRMGRTSGDNEYFGNTFELTGLLREKQKIDEGQHDFYTQKNSGLESWGKDKLDGNRCSARKVEESEYLERNRPNGNECIDKKKEEKTYFGKSKLDGNDDVREKQETNNHLTYKQPLRKGQEKEYFRKMDEAKKNLGIKQKVDKSLRKNKINQNQIVKGKAEANSYFENQKHSVEFEKNEHVENNVPCGNVHFESNKLDGSVCLQSKSQIANQIGHKQQLNDRQRNECTKNKRTRNENIGNKRNEDNYLLGMKNEGVKYLRNKPVSEEHKGSKYWSWKNICGERAKMKSLANMTSVQESHIQPSEESDMERNSIGQRSLFPHHNLLQQEIVETPKLSELDVGFSISSQATIQYSKGHRDLQYMDKEYQGDSSTFPQQSVLNLQRPMLTLGSNQSDSSQKLYEDMVQKRNRKLKRKLSAQAKGRHPSLDQSHSRTAPKQKRLSCNFDSETSIRKNNRVDLSLILENDADSDMEKMKLYVRDYDKNVVIDRWSSSSNADSWSRHHLGGNDLKRRDCDADNRFLKRPKMRKPRECFVDGTSSQDSVSPSSFPHDNLEIVVNNNVDQESKNDTASYSIRKSTSFHETDACNKETGPTKKVNASSEAFPKSKEVTAGGEPEKGKLENKTNAATFRRQDVMKIRGESTNNLKKKMNRTPPTPKQRLKNAMTQPESKPPAQSRLSKMKKLRYKFHKAPAKPKTQEDNKSASASELMNHRDLWSTNSSTKRDTQPIDTSSYQILKNSTKPKPASSVGAVQAMNPKIKMRHPRYKFNKGLSGNLGKCQAQESQTKLIPERSESGIGDRDNVETNGKNGVGDSFTTAYKTLHQIPNKRSASPTPAEQNSRAKVYNLKYKLPKLVPKRAHCKESKQSDKRKKEDSESNDADKKAHDGYTYRLMRSPALKARNPADKSPSFHGRNEGPPPRLPNSGSFTGKEMKSSNVGRYSKGRQRGGAQKPILNSGRNNTADVAIVTTWNKKGNKTPKAQSYLQAFRDSTRMRSPSLITSIQSTEKASDLNFPKPPMENGEGNTWLTVDTTPKDAVKEPSDEGGAVDNARMNGHPDDAFDLSVAEDDGYSNSHDNSDRDRVPFPSSGMYDQSKTQRGLTSILSNLAYIEELDPDEEEKLSLPQHLPDLIMTSSVDSSGGPYNLSGYSNNSEFVLEDRVHGSNETCNHAHVNERNVQRLSQDKEEPRRSIRLTLSPTCVNNGKITEDKIPSKKTQDVKGVNKSSEKITDEVDTNDNIAKGMNRMTSSRMKISQMQIQNPNHDDGDDVGVRESSQNGFRSHSNIVKRFPSPERIMNSVNPSSDVSRGGRSSMKQRNSTKNFSTPNFQDIFKDTETLQQWTKANIYPVEARASPDNRADGDVDIGESAISTRHEIQENKDLNKEKEKTKNLTHELKRNPFEKTASTRKTDAETEMVTSEDGLRPDVGDDIQGRNSPMTRDKEDDHDQIENNVKSCYFKSYAADSELSNCAKIDSSPSLLMKFKRLKTDDQSLSGTVDNKRNGEITKSEKSNMQSCSEIVISWMDADDKGGGASFKTKRKNATGSNDSENTRDHEVHKNGLLSSNENTTVEVAEGESLTEKSHNIVQPSNTNPSQEAQAREHSHQDNSACTPKGENIFLKMERIKRAQINERRVVVEPKETFSIKRDRLGKPLSPPRGSAYYVKSAMTYNKKKNMCGKNARVCTHDTYSVGNSGDETIVQDQTNQLTASKSNPKERLISASITAAADSSQSAKRMMKNNNKTRITLTSGYTTRIDAVEHDDTQTTHYNTCSLEDDNLGRGDENWDDTSNDVLTDELCSGCSSSWGACVTPDKIATQSPTSSDHNADDTESNSSQQSSNDQDNERSKSRFLLDWYRPTLQAKAGFSTRTNATGEEFDDDDDDFDDVDDIDNNDNDTNDDDDSLYESVSDEYTDSDTSANVQNDTYTCTSEDRTNSGGASNYITSPSVPEASTSSPSCRGRGNTNSKYTDPSFRSTFTWCNRHRTLNQTLSNNTRLFSLQDKKDPNLHHSGNGFDTRLYSTSMNSRPLDRCQCHRSGEGLFDRSGCAVLGSFGTNEIHQKDSTVGKSESNSPCTGSVSSVGDFSTVCHHCSSDSGTNIMPFFGGATREKEVPKLGSSYFRKRPGSFRYSSGDISGMNGKAFGYGNSSGRYNYLPSTGSENDGMATFGNMLLNDGNEEELGGRDEGWGGTTFCTCSSSSSASCVGPEMDGSSGCSPSSTAGAEKSSSQRGIRNKRFSVRNSGSHWRPGQNFRGVRSNSTMHRGLYRYRKPMTWNRQTKRKDRRDVFSTRDSRNNT